MFVSAKNGVGISDLIKKIEEIIKQNKKECDLLLPYSAQSMLSMLYDEYSVKSVEYTDEGISVIAILDEKGRGIYSKFIR